MEFDLQDAIARLERTPRVLEALLGGLPPAWAAANEGGDSWSPFDVVGHLIHGEQTDWIQRARIILEHGPSKPFEPFDRFAQFDASKGKTLRDLLDTFASLRRENIAALRAMNLQPGDLARTGQHPALGEVTLGQLIATWATHDLDHLHQIVRTLARQYAGEVGPWGAYLGVLHD
jgi:hypothetical protein